MMTPTEQYKYDSKFRRSYVYYDSTFDDPKTATGSNL